MAAAENGPGGSAADVMRLKEALRTVGGLSDPRAMPELAWSLPARACRAGSRLAAVPGTACSVCYAKKGHYSLPAVQRALERRLAALDDPRWEAAMEKCVDELVERWFRWFDSGDVQGTGHYRAILRVAARTTRVSHWLPTQERRLVKRAGVAAVPENLVVRISGARIDGPPDKGWPWAGAVVSDKADATCVKHLHGGCCPPTCRACWDRGVALVKSPKH